MVEQSSIVKAQYFLTKYIKFKMFLAHCHYFVRFLVHSPLQQPSTSICIPKTGPPGLHPQVPCALHLQCGPLRSPEGAGLSRPSCITCLGILEAGNNTKQ